jgi:hypothetical protein
MLDNMTSIRQNFKGALVGIGSWLSPAILSRLASILNYLYTGRWMREHNLKPPVRVNDRMELIDVIAGPNCRTGSAVLGIRRLERGRHTPLVSAFEE